MPYKIAIVNPKGGVGKTTTAVNLAGFFVSSGKPCLVIDLDDKAESLKHLGIKNNNTGLSEVILSNRSLANAVRKTKILGYDLIGIGMQAKQLTQSLYRSSKPSKKIKQLFPKRFKLPYSFIIFDCPATSTILTQSAVAIADSILIPIQAEYFAFSEIKTILNLYTKKKILGILITMADKRNNICNNIIQNVYAKYPDKTFKTIIPRNTKLAEATQKGMPIFQYSPLSQGAKAYKNLSKEIINKLKPKL